MERTVLSPRSWVDVGSVPPELAPGLDSPGFEDLWDLRPAQRGTVVLRGRRQRVPRYQMAWGVGYAFAGQTLIADPPEPPAVLQRYLDWANWRSGYGSGRFNGILLNWYEHGGDNIGYHSDVADQLVAGEPILSLSLGQERTFCVTRKWGCPRCKVQVQSHEWRLPHGALLVMGGDTQAEFVHAVPEEEGASDLRINVTIRAFATNPDGTPAPVPAPPAAAQDNSGSGSGDGGSSGSGSSEPAAKRRRA